MDFDGFSLPGCELFCQICDQISEAPPLSEHIGIIFSFQETSAGPACALAQRHGCLCDAGARWEGLTIGGSRHVKLLTNQRKWMAG